MSKAEIEKLAESWIKASELGLNSNEDDKFLWAIEKMLDLPREDPELAWAVIMEILNKNPSPKIISLLGAGPLEDLMSYHGNSFMEKVKVEATKNTLFKDCMRSVWLDENDLDNYKLFYEIAGIDAPFDT